MNNVNYRLGDIVTFINGRAFLMPELQNNGKYRIVRVGNFSGKDEWFYSDMELEEDKYCSKGDLLYKWACNFGPEIWNEEKVIYHYHIWKVINNETKIDKTYLYYLLKVMTPYWLCSTNGSTMVHITKNIIEDKIINIPKSIKEQQAIAKILKQLDSKIALNNKINDNLQQQAKLLYDYWFNQFEFPNEEGKPYKSSGGKMVWNEELKREIPEGWEVKEISKIADLYQPKTISSNLFNKNGKYLVFGANGIIGRYDEYNHKDNEIAICCRGASCGDFLMTIPCSWITGNSMVISPKNKAYKEYIFYSLNKDKIANYITGSAQPQITRTNLNEMLLTVPSNNIITNFDKYAIVLRKKQIEISKEDEKLSQLRDWLLPMLMNGQATVED